jgi:hypothetical protein
MVSASEKQLRLETRATCNPQQRKRMSLGKLQTGLATSGFNSYALWLGRGNLGNATIPRFLKSPNEYQYLLAVEAKWITNGGFPYTGNQTFTYTSAGSIFIRWPQVNRQCRTVVSRYANSAKQSCETIVTGLGCETRLTNADSSLHWQFAHFCLWRFSLIFFFGRRFRFCRYQNDLVVFNRQLFKFP